MNILGASRSIDGPTRLRMMRRGGGAPAVPDYSTAQIGDEIGGGVYAGADPPSNVTAEYVPVSAPENVQTEVL